MVNVVQGQRQAFPIDINGNLTRNAFVTLARAEDPRVPSWQVTLAPITQNAGASALPGMPAWANPATNNGDIVARLTWGAGGTLFQTTFAYPVAGASFAVAGDNIVIEAAPQNGATAFTDATRPAVAGWVKPHASPTAYAPLVVWEPTAQGVDVPVFPWTRALLVGKTTPTDTITITVNIEGGNTIAIGIPASVGIERIPLPTGARSYNVTASTGLAVVGAELAFT